MAWFVASWVLLGSAALALRHARRALRKAEQETGKCRLLLAAAEASARAAEEQRAAALEAQDHVKAILGEWTE